MYRQILNTEYNLSFFVPKKDICDIFLRYDSGTETFRQSMEDHYKQHIKSKELSRIIKEKRKYLRQLKSMLLYSTYKHYLSWIQMLTCLTIDWSSPYTISWCIIWERLPMWDEFISKRIAWEIGNFLLKPFIPNHRKALKIFSNNWGVRIEINIYMSYTNIEIIIKSLCWHNFNHKLNYKLFFRMESIFSKEKIIEFPLSSF